jgi:hypothetical protein
MKSSRALVFDIVAFLLVILALIVIQIGVYNMARRANKTYEENKISVNKLSEAESYDSLAREVKEAIAMAHVEVQFTASASDNLYGIVKLIVIAACTLLGVLIIRNGLQLIKTKAGTRN